MPANVIQANYETLDQVARLFDQNAQVIEKTLWKMIDTVEALASDGWWGSGADAFYAEMEDEVLPQVRRLKASLEQSTDYIQRISDVLQDAEEEASRCFNTDDAIITPQGNTSEYSYGGGSGDGVGDYDYDPTERPDGLIFIKTNQVRPFGGIDNQFGALDDYVASGNTLPSYSFFDYEGTPLSSVQIGTPESNPELYVHNEDGSLYYDENGKPVPITTSFNIGDDGNICGPMTLAAVANAILGNRGDDIIHPGKALSDLIDIWNTGDNSISITNPDGTVIATTGRDPSAPTWVSPDLSNLGESYGLNPYMHESFQIRNATVADAQAVLEGELDQGRVPVVLVNIDGDGYVATEVNPGSLTNHYVAVTSIQTGSDGQTWVEIYNPYNNQMEYYHMEDLHTSFVTGNTTVISFGSTPYQDPATLDSPSMNLANFVYEEPDVRGYRGDAP